MQTALLQAFPAAVRNEDEEFTKMSSDLGLGFSLPVDCDSETMDDIIAGA